MKRIHCNGCGMQEDMNAPKHKIRTVTLSVEEDSRTWAQQPTFEADLCDDCQNRLLHNYFGVLAKGMLEIPAFIEPVQEPQSLRAVR